MRSMAFKESGTCMLPHLITKLCEYWYSTMPSSLEHDLIGNALINPNSVFPRETGE